MNKSTLVLIVTSITACSPTSRETKNTRTDARETKTDIIEKPLKINELLTIADQRVNDTIVFRGVVKHTCSHSGRRCFIADPSGKTTIRVESGGNIKGFNRELVDSEINITGILKEQRFSRKYLDNWEKKLQEKEDEGEKKKNHCNTGKNNILKMREWMKKNNKDTYVIYYVQGIDYNIVK